MADLSTAIAATANSLRTLGQQAAGKAGKAIDVIGTKLNNPLPQISAFGPQGLSGALEAAGAGAMTTQEQIKKVQQDPRFQPENAAKTGNPDITTIPNQPTPTPTGGESDKQAAQRIISDMNAGKIPWDDNARAQANNVLSGGSAGGGKLDSAAVSKMVTDVGADGFINADDLQKIYDKYGGAADRASDIAKEIENTARANAEAEYNETRRALGIQKEEVATVAGKQKGDITKQKELTTEELKAKEESESAKIEGESAAFADTIDTQKEQLAQNWKDLSLYTQRIMRARGVSESSFASDKESALMLDFNKGLRQLAKTSTDALQSFSDAVIETNKFYTRQQAQLNFDTNKQMEDVDTWVRQKVEEIQGKENVALNSKLADIRTAISQGNQLKIQTAQQIEDRKAALDTWLVQTTTQYKIAVATAAAGKVSDAKSGIDNAFAMTNMIAKQLDNGMATMTLDKTTNLPVIHGSIVNADGTTSEYEMPITAGAYQNYQTTQLYKAAQASNAGMTAGLTLPTATTPAKTGVVSGLLGAIGL